MIISIHPEHVFPQTHLVAFVVILLPNKQKAVFFFGGCFIKLHGKNFCEFIKLPLTSKTRLVCLVNLKKLRYFLKIVQILPIKLEKLNNFSSADSVRKHI